ncbi:MAG: hypothetical protein SVV80_12190 [Planctomycetota bacterium]|nr:hypothetical protein [Planctomycetota bacterium]
MSKRISCVIAIASVLLAGPGGLNAQDATSVQPAAPAGDVLKHIPAGCMGFVVVNNVQNFTGKIDGFLQQISPPEQPLVQGKILDMIRGAARLGEGFNANGGFAAVILDPQVYGVDLVEMITGKAKPTEPGEEPKKQPSPPVVLIVPTTDNTLVNMLAAYQPVKEGDYIKLPRQGDEPIYCKVAGSYALIGPNLQAVRNVSAGEKSILTQLSATDKAVITRNDVGVWVNLKMLCPILDAAIVKMEKEAAEGGQMGFGPGVMIKKSMSRNFASMREIIKQLDDFSTGLRINNTGILIDGRCSFLTDSVLGKALAACKPVAGSLLNRLPNMPYIVAFGARNEPKTPKDFNIKQIDNMLAGEPFTGLSADAKAKLRTVMLGLEEQIDSVQLYLGGNTSGSGQVGAVYVLECKSADTVKTMLADAAAVANEVIQAAEDENLKKLSVRYHKALESVADKEVDVIDIDHPEINTMEEDDREKMKAVLGEDKVRLLVASADDKTLVITLGGSKALLTEAMKTARGTGTLQTDPGVAKSLAMLPKQRMGVGLLNIGNIFKVIKNISAAIGEEPPPIPPITAEEPFAGSISIQGSDMSFTGYLPTKTIGEIARTFMGMFMGGRGRARPMPPPGGGEDF